MAAGWKDALMADTGAPWNIPYVEPADLVRDYPAADEAQALAIAAGLTDASLIRDVVAVVKDDTFSTTSSTLVNVTGLAATITPKAATNKILVTYMMTVGQGNDANNIPQHRLLRGSTGILDHTGESFTGDARTPDVSNGATQFPMFFGNQVLDSPGVITAVTYQLQVARSAGTITVNGNFAGRKAVSSITLIEVAA